MVNSPNTNWSEQLLQRLSIPNPLAQDIPNPPADYYTCQFRNTKLERWVEPEHTSVRCLIACCNQTPGRRCSFQLVPVSCFHPVTFHISFL